MQKLKFEKHVLLTESVIRKLSQNRITTVLEFLHENSEKLSNLTKLSLSQILEIRTHIFQKYSAPMINGSSLINIFSRSKHLSTGLASLDNALDGGIPLGFITEICGLAESGKTQLCHQIAINCIRSTEKTVVYIDTKGDFSAMRIQKVLDSLGFSHKDMALVMYKLRVVFIWTMDELLELLRKIKNKVLVFENLAMIIIDSLPCLMFQHLGDSNKIGLAYLNMMVNYSRYISDTFHISFVCVNIQTRWVDQDISELEDEDESISVTKDTYLERKNRCLGKYWQHIPMTLVMVEKGITQENTDGNTSLIINGTVIKKSNRECNDSFIITINNLGVT